MVRFSREFQFEFYGQKVTGRICYLTVEQGQALTSAAAHGADDTLSAMVAVVDENLVELGGTKWEPGNAGKLPLHMIQHIFTQTQVDDLPKGHGGSESGPA